MPIDIATRRSDEELSRLGDEILHLQIEPKHGATETGKFVAIDVDSGSYEINENDHTAVMRLLDRHPSADIWLACIGMKATYQLRSIR